MRVFLYILLWCGAFYLISNYLDHHARHIDTAYSAGTYVAMAFREALTTAPWWVLGALPLGALLALGRRLRWRSYSWRPWLIWTPFALLAALLLIIGNSFNQPTTIGWFLLQILYRPHLFPLPVHAWELQGQIINAALYFLVGSTMGATVGMVLVALFRTMSGDVGFYSHQLSFRWRKGSEDVMVRYRKGRVSRKTDRVPLGQFFLSFKEEIKEGTDYAPNIQTSTGTTSSGEHVSLTTYGPGTFYNYKRATGRTEVHIGGDVDGNVFLRKWSCVEANANWKRLAKPKEQLREATDRQHKAETLKKKEDDQARFEATLAKANQAIKDMAEQAGLADELWNWHNFSTQPESAGKLLNAIGADRQGRGFVICNQGQSQWIGSWKGARVQESSKGLDIQVNDPEYRHRHMTERRFCVGETWTVQKCQEWASRIRLLSQ